MIGGLSRLIDFLLDKVLKWPFAILVIVFYYDIALVFLATFEKFIAQESPIYLLGMLTCLMIIRHRSNFDAYWQTFEHELAHAIVGMLCLKKIDEFKVHKTFEEANADPNGFRGYVQFSTDVNWVIWLAPYFLPTLTLLLSLIYFLPIGEYRIILDFFIGFSIGFHLRTNWVEFGRNWNPAMPSGYTDITAVGKVFSLIVLPALNMIAFTIIFQTITG